MVPIIVRRDEVATLETDNGVMVTAGGLPAKTVMVTEAVAVLESLETSTVKMYTPI